MSICYIGKFPFGVVPLGSYPCGDIDCTLVGALWVPFLLFLCVSQDPSSHFIFGYNLKEDDPAFFPVLKVYKSNCINVTIKGETFCISKLCWEYIYPLRFSCDLSCLLSLIVNLR